MKSLSVIILLLLIAQQAIAELTHEIKIDQKQALIIQALKNKDNVDCPAVINNTNELEKLIDNIPPTLYYYRADCLSNARKYQEAKQDIEKFLSKNKKKGSVYKKALVLYSKVE